MIQQKNIMSENTHWLFNNKIENMPQKAQKTA